ncbi:hypothetical protein QBC39DRAFT_30471 [Podospora conica]|nr:hypothetical protein QBC39DRAFT_30471 [Schizothecium conicum]
MADPLSIAASVAGLITLADTIFRASFQYAKSAKNAKQEALDLASEAQDLAGVLHRLSLVASAFETDPEPERQHTLRLHHVLSCRRMLLRVEKALAKASSDFDAGKARAVRRAVKWPFSSTEVKELLDEIGRHKATLSLALTADTMDALMRSLTLQDTNEGHLAALGCGVRETMQIVTNIQLNDQRRRVLDFFMAANPQQSLAQCHSLRHPETGLWLLEGDEFQHWVTQPNSKLWLSGIPGAGKTVLAGSVVSEVLALGSSVTGIAFFFCEYKRSETQKPINVVQTMASQLARQNNKAYELLEEYYRELHPSQGIPNAPSLWAMREVLRQMIACFNTVYMVIDGLDECDEFAREVAIMLAETVQDEENLSLAILSRDELVIRESLEGSFVHLDIEAQRDDVRLYVASELELRTRRGQLRLRSVGLKDEILRVLVDENGGMFRWVTCQLDYLCELPRDKDRRDALKSLPPTLNGTYQRILERIDAKSEEVRRLVKRCLLFISITDPPMTIDELRVAVSIEADTESLDEESVVDEAAILQHCSSLVRRCEVPDATNIFYVEFSHFSVLEYLQGPFLDGTDLEQYQVSDREATRTLAIACLRTISLNALAFRFTTARDDIERADQRRQQCPFYTYAAFCWFPLSREHWEDDTITTLTNALFSPEKPNIFLSWIFELCLVYLRPPVNSTESDDGDGDDDTEVQQIIQEFSSSTLSKSFTPLHVACALGLRPICQKLVESGADVNATCTLGTPLYCATNHAALFPPSYNRYSFHFMPRRVTFDDNDEASGVVDVHAEGSDDELGPVVEEATDRHLTFRSFLYNFEAQRPGIVQLLLDHGATPLNSPGSGGIRLFQAALWTSHQMKTMAMVKSLVEAGITLTPSDIHQFDTATKRKWSLSDPAEAARIMNDLGSFVAFLEETSSSSKAAAHLYPFARDFMISINRAGEPSGDQKALPAAVELIKDPFTTAVLAAQYNNDVELEKILQENEIDLSKRVNSKGQTILHIAVQNGSLESARALLRHGCSQSTPDFAGTLPVWLCSRDVCSAVMRLMLENDPGQVRQRDNKGNTIWHMAAALNSCEILRVLKDMSPDFERDLKIRNLKGANPLAVALHRLREDAAVLIVEYMPSLVSAWVGRTPVLHLAARLGSADLIRILVDAGADIGKRAVDGSNPLHYLTQTCTVPCVQLLKSLYPDLYDRNNRRRRPLEAFTVNIGKINAFEWPRSRALDLIQIFNELVPMDAIAVAPGGQTFWEEFCSGIIMRREDGDKGRYNNHMQNRSWLEAIVRRLMQIGALQKHEEIKGTSAASILIAAFNSSSQISIFRWHGSSTALVGVVQLLLEPEGATRFRDEALTSSGLVMYLHGMISSGALRAVRTLVDLGVNLRMKLRGYSALEVACLRTNAVPAELLRIVLDGSGSSEINTLNKEIGGLGLVHLIGKTVRARLRKTLTDPSAVARLQLLLEEGADQHLLTANGTSAIAFHIKHRNTETATVLLDHGADASHVDSKGFDAIMHAVLRNRVEFLAYVLNMEREGTLVHAVDWNRRVNLVWDRVMRQRASWRRTGPVHDSTRGRFEGCNALHVAALLGHTKVLEFLLREELIDDINAKAVGGWTASHFAAYSGVGHAIKVLHRWGADLSLDASDGTCPEPLTPSAVVPDGFWARSAAQTLISLRPQPNQQTVPSAGDEQAGGTPNAADDPAREISGFESGSDRSSILLTRSSGYNTASDVSDASIRRRRMLPRGVPAPPLIPDVILARHMTPAPRSRLFLPPDWPPLQHRLRPVSRTRDFGQDPRIPPVVITIPQARRNRVSSPGASETTTSSDSSDSSDSSFISEPTWIQTLSWDEGRRRKCDIERAIRESDLFTLERLFGLHPRQMEQPLYSCEACTPLLYAIRAEKTEAIKWLVEQGAKLDALPCHRHRPPAYRNKWLAAVPFMVASLRSLNSVLDLVLASYLALVGNPFSNGPSSAEGPWTLFGGSPLHAAVWGSNHGAIPVIMKHIEMFKRTYKTCVCCAIQGNISTTLHPSLSTKRTAPEAPRSTWRFQSSTGIASPHSSNTVPMLTSTTGTETGRFTY